MPTVLNAEQLAAHLAVRDLTDPAAGPHAQQSLVEAAARRLAAAWGCEVRWHRGPRIVPVEDNYDRLGFDAEAVARDGRYTRYVDAGRVLRGHASAMIPPALRALAEDRAEDCASDVLLACPGVVYRRDSINRIHTATPHQLDLWRVSRGRLGPADLDEMVALLVDELAPGRPWRAEPRVHPYTLDGRQIDVLWDEEWVEVWECGLAHPEVLEGAGLPSGSWTGLALGMGLDRLLMLRKGIPDIRLLRSEHPRVASQLRDLGPYRPVSSMPAVRRDLSIAVDADDVSEDLGDRVRDALGADAAGVEEVAVLAETPYEDLPRAARVRLGMGRGQKNMLVRVVLRHLERTLTDEEANVLRDRVYGALHRGTVHQWASDCVRATQASHGVRATQAGHGVQATQAGPLRSG